MAKNVKITADFNLLDLIAPLNCRGCNALGRPLCERCKNYNIKNRHNLCPRCKTENLDGFCKNCHNNLPIFVYDYKENLIGTLIHDYKYTAVRALADPLADFLNSALPDLPLKTVVVPLPTSTRHIRARGFDHMQKIAGKFAKLRGLQVKPLLSRVKNTVQVGADAETRKLQAEAAFVVSPRIPIDPTATYLLLDDVWTTGASMEAAVAKLRAAGAKNLIISVLALTATEE